MDFSTVVLSTTQMYTNDVLTEGDFRGYLLMLFIDVMQSRKNDQTLNPDHGK